MTRKILSDAAAQREAQRRWGKTGAVKRERCFLFENRDGSAKRNKAGQTSCSGFGAAGHGVGCCPGGRIIMNVGRLEAVGGFGFFMIRGTGSTWAEAFDNAERAERAV